MKKIKNKRGVTLVALVITIVVLLILSAVIIGTLNGENRIITQSKIASFKAEMAQVRECVDINKIARFDYC